MLTADQTTLIVSLAGAGHTAHAISKACHVGLSTVMDVAVPHMAAKGWTARTIALGRDVHERQVERRLVAA